MVMCVPGKFALDLRHFDVLIVNLTDDSRRPKLCKRGTGEFKRDGTLLTHCARNGLVAVARADGDLVTTLGAAAAQHSGPGLGLHAAQEAMGLRAMTAVGLKGTLRHGKNSCAGGR